MRHIYGSDQQSGYYDIEDPLQSHSRDLILPPTFHSPSSTAIDIGKDQACFVVEEIYHGCIRGPVINSSLGTSDHFRLGNCFGADSKVSLSK